MTAEDREIADVLERVADLLEVQQANPFRVRAFRNAARAARDAPRPVVEILAEEGPKGLERLPGIGRGIASAIHEYVTTGRLGMLERLEGEVAPEDLFARVPGIGEGLAHRIREQLGIETLEDLELAAHDGRLEALHGFGRRRVEGVRQALAGMLARSARRRLRELRAREAPPPDRPDVGTLLSVDDEYRRRAAAGELRRIAPRRFNPTGEAWLPILHTERGDWHFTALFSNTAQAHELGTTHDWVVIYYERDGREDQCTVVTETRGPLEGRRVVRGREAECRAFYDAGP